MTTHTPNPTSSGQDEIYNLLTKHPLTDGSSGYVLPTVELLAIQDAIAHHTQEAVEAAREKAIDDCIAVVRNKQLEDAEELAKRMSELSASQQSTSPDGEKKDGDE